MTSTKIRPCFDLTGLVFGQWTVISQIGCPDHISESKKTKAYWLCQCSCGHKSILLGSTLRCGRSKSCGCSTVFNFKETMHKKGCK